MRILQYSKLAYLVIFFLPFIISGCATIGPQITSEEEKHAQAILMAKAQAWQKELSLLNFTLQPA